MGCTHVLGEVGRFREGPNARRDQILSVELVVQYAPIAVFAFERLQPYVRSSVYCEGSGYGKSFTAAGDIAQIGFWVKIGRRSVRNRELGGHTLSWVWRRICCCSVAASEKCCLQSLHWNGLCPVCICRTSINFKVENTKTDANLQVPAHLLLAREPFLPTSFTAAPKTLIVVFA